MQDVNIIQILLIFIVTFIAAIDQFDLLESLYQPIVMGPVVGLILGDLNTGLIVGGTYQLMTIGNMPVGGAQPPNAVIGGIMATVLAISLNMDPAGAVGAAIPFALLGQYGITLLFTVMSPMMTKADKFAEEADYKGIDRLNYMAMGILGLIFAIIVTLFFIGGQQFGSSITGFFDKYPWIMAGLTAAGNMMRFVGFAILLKVMISRELWGFYFMGFSLAIIVDSVGSLGSSALLVLALIGFGLAFWDYQVQSKLNKQTVVENYGGEQDGI